MTKHALLCLMTLVPSSISFSGQKNSTGEIKSRKVAQSGDSVLETKVGGKTIRVVITTYRIDIGSPSQEPPPAGEANTNCTYSRFPCSQVSNLQVWVEGKRLFVPRSAFADAADVGNMSVTSEAGAYAVALDGGDASEAYTVKLFFGAHRVRKRELYHLESDSLLEVTTYLPSPVLN